MPGVDLEESIFQSPRLRRMARAMGVTHFDALGRLAYLWRWCTEAGTDRVSAADIDAIMEHEGAAQSLLEAELSELVYSEHHTKVGGNVNSEFRIKGGSRCFWRDKLRAAGQKGGLEKARRARAIQEEARFQQNSRISSSLPSQARGLLGMASEGQLAFSTPLPLPLPLPIPVSNESRRDDLERENIPGIGGSGRKGTEQGREESWPGDFPPDPVPPQDLGHGTDPVPVSPSSRATARIPKDLPPVPRRPPSTKTKPGGRFVATPDRAYKAADYLRQRILEWQPNCTACRDWPAQKRAAWARDLSRLHTAVMKPLCADRVETVADDDAWRMIAKAIAWLYGEGAMPGRCAGDFVVMSASALREKWDKIQAAMAREATPRPKNGGNGTPKLHRVTEEELADIAEKRREADALAVELRAAQAQRNRKQEAGNGDEEAANG